MGTYRFREFSSDDRMIESSDDRIIKLKSVGWFRQKPIFFVDFEIHFL